MSRIGKQIIIIPEKTTAVIDDSGLMVVKGPLGEISRMFDTSNIQINIGENDITSKLIKKTKQSAMLWGTYMSHIKNMITGVSKMFEKKLIIEGVGYKGEVSGENLKLALGFSHPVIIPIPENINISVEKNSIIISGVDKEKVGQFSATIRSKRPPEPYKGKGIRYDGEVIRRKQGKKSVT